MTNNSSFLLKKTSMKLKKERKIIKNKAKQKQIHNQVKKNRFFFGVFIYQILGEYPLLCSSLSGLLSDQWSIAIFMEFLLIREDKQQIKQNKGREWKAGWCAIKIFRKASQS